MVTAPFNSFGLTYNDSLAFCESVNGTLPRMRFQVVEPDGGHKRIFWIAANDKSRQEAKDYSRKQLHVAYTNSPNNETTLCAMVGKIGLMLETGSKKFIVSEIFNQVRALLFICEEQVFDEQNRVIWVNNFTAGCNIFKPNLTVLTEFDFVEKDLTGKAEIKGLL